MDTKDIRESSAGTFIHMGMVVGIVLVFAAMLFLPAIAHNSRTPMQQNTGVVPMSADLQ
jgi:hypothetical protein